ncbi:MAG: acyl-CoA dehydrogenase, partial [Gemmatimonadetes bacterium]|nr:acyl-CoA dehydrogenase [Gemmatimonadota bacterium]
MSERDAREVAEAAREQEWKAPSFVRELFEGRFRLHLIHPYPTLDPEEEARAKPWLDQLAAFLRATVDAEAIDRDAKIPREYGGLGFSQTVYNRAVALAATVESSIGVLLSAHQSIGVPQPLK